MGSTARCSSVGQDDRPLVDPHPDVEPLRGDAGVVDGLAQRKSVVGQTHLAAQHVVVGDQTFGLHLPDVPEPPLRLFDVAAQHVALFPQGEEVHVLAQQLEFHLRTVGLCAEAGDPLLDFGPADAAADAAALVERLDDVDGVVLRPVGGIGIGGVAQTVFEDDGLPHEAALEADVHLRQTFRAGRAAAVAAGLFLDAAGLETEAVFNAELQQPLYRKQERVGLGDVCGGGCALPACGKGEGLRCRAECRQAERGGQQDGKRPYGANRVRHGT